MAISNGNGTSGRQFALHDQRGTVLGEVHARPFYLTETPRGFLHFAFMTGGKSVDEERAWLNALCIARGAPTLSASARFHQVPFGSGILRWEGHSEFSTYTWDGPLLEESTAFGADPSDHPFGDAFEAPGPMIVAIRLELRPQPESLDRICNCFDPISLCISRVEADTASIVTDFKQDGDGRTRILVLDKGMSSQSAGALVLRLLEIETYRTLALLGLPEAHQCGPGILEIEEKLSEISAELPETKNISANRNLLHLLSKLATQVEAIGATSAFRFGATRAYYEIVTLRLRAIEEETEPGYSTWATFLTRRLAPAMRTCQATETRLETLSTRLSRAAGLLRTRVDVELEEQNRVLLESMNKRARLQLRLQQTVEGLSVAAISYYVVGLTGYIAKGLKAAGLGVDDKIVVALAVPVVVAAIWWVVRRIRKHHGDDATSE